MKNIVIDLDEFSVNLSSHEKSIYLKLIAQVLAREAYVSCDLSNFHNRIHH